MPILPNLESYPSDIVDGAEHKSPFVLTFPVTHRIFLSIVLISYYIAVAVWNNPDGVLKTRLMSAIRIPVDFFAVEQVWNMFGPVLRQWNGHIIAVITFRDGTSKIYEFPRMEMMSDFVKYKREKMRKLFIDNLTDSQFEDYYPAVARSLARANYQARNPPSMVTLTLKFKEIPEPTESNLTGRYELPIRSDSRTLLVYRVSPADLVSP